MNDFRFDRKATPPTETPRDPMAEIYGLLGEMQVGGAMDEEGPFISNLLHQIDRGQISPEEALKHVRAKAQARNDYH